jgi:hypothetical protein
MHCLLLLALLTSGCALRAPLVTPGQTIYVILAYVQTEAGVRAIGEPFVVDAVLGNGYVLGHNPGDSTQWVVNMGAVIQFTDYPPRSTHPPTNLQDGVRERVSR